MYKKVKSIIDKIKNNKKETFLLFWNKIAKEKLSESDKIWILCFMHKNQIKEETLNTITNSYFGKQIWNNLKKYLLNPNDQQSNLFRDADKWSYGDSSLPH